MIFRQLYDSDSSTYTYLLADAATLEGVIIDPVFEQATRDLALINELGINLLFSIDTHCHADHVTASWLLKQKTGCKVAVAKVVGAEHVDVELVHGDQIGFGMHSLEVRATPGHTDGCLTYVLDDRSMAFTGDTLLIRGCGRSDFQQGDASTLFHSITDEILSLPDNCLIYPAHDYNGRTVSSVAEERVHNARIGGNANERDFVEFMNAMRLPHPKSIDIALPANLKSGKPSEDALSDEPAWAPARVTFAGIVELEPEWVARERDRLCILDVRGDDELNAGNSRISIDYQIPLNELRDRTGEIESDKPLAVFCRSGRRSAIAVSILKQAGFERVANISGGLLKWKENGLPVT